MSQVLETLKQIDFLDGFDEVELQLIASIASEVSYQAGEILFRENSPAESIYLIIEGSASLEICAPGVGCRRILTVGRGELLGWSPALENTRFTATSKAITDVMAVKISGHELLEICNDNPSLGFHFMQRVALALSKRLNATRLQLLNVFGSETQGSLESSHLHQG